jgi:hypothetical protein
MKILWNKKLTMIYGFPRVVHGTFFKILYKFAEHVPLTYRKSTCCFLISIHDQKVSVQCVDVSRIVSPIFFKIQ